MPEALEMCSTAMLKSPAQEKSRVSFQRDAGPKARKYPSSTEMHGLTGRIFSLLCKVLVLNLAG